MVPADPAGALLLGRMFSAWNMLAYGTGIAVGASLDRCAAPAVAGAGAVRETSSAS